ncbi:hypothetical protein ACWIEX_21360 [Bosea sp. NPDC055353]
MPDDTIDFRHVRMRIVRSALTIATYAALGPLLTLFSYDLLLNFSWLLHAHELYGMLGVLLVARLSIFYFGGFVHALLAGCFVALLSPSIVRNTAYIGASCLIGAIVALVFPLPGPHIFHSEFWFQAGPKLIACFALGSMLCAVLTLPFRAKPEPMR